jgi:hypothetical protein
MSQFGQGITTGSLPSVVATTYTTDQFDIYTSASDVGASAGTVSAQGNVLRVFGNNGIVTSQISGDAGVLEINFDHSKGETNGAVLDNLFFLSIPVGKTYTLQYLVSGISITDGTSSIGASGTACIKNVSGVASLVGVPSKTVYNDAPLAGCVITPGAGIGGFVINVTGVAGQDIQWGASVTGFSTT